MLSFLLILVTSVYAYIPQPQYILQSAAQSHGESVYSIEQEVRFKVNEQAYALREFWIVEGMNFMRLRLEGQGQLKDQAQGVWIYNKGHGFHRNEMGKRASNVIGPEMFEQFFHFRSTSDGEKLLNQARIVSHSEWQASQKKSIDLEKLDFTPPAFVRWSRAGGLPTLAFGVPTPVGEDPKPGLWIESNRYFVRKVRTSKGLEVKADQYTMFEKNLWFPQVRQVKFPTGEATITLLSVKSLSKNEYIRNRLQPSSLFDPKEKDLERMNVKLPEVPVVKDFYLNYR